MQKYRRAVAMAQLGLQLLHGAGILVRAFNHNDWDFLFSRTCGLFSDWDGAEWKWRLRSIGGDGDGEISHDERATSDVMNSQIFSE